MDIWTNMNIFTLRTFYITSKRIWNNKAYPRTLSEAPLVVLFLARNPQFLPICLSHFSSTKSSSSSTEVKCSSSPSHSAILSFCVLRVLTIWPITFRLKIDERGSWWVQSPIWEILLAHFLFITFVTLPLISRLALHQCGCCTFCLIIMRCVLRITLHIHCVAFPLRYFHEMFDYMACCVTIYFIPLHL